MFTIIAICKYFGLGQRGEREDHMKTFRKFFFTKIVAKFKITILASVMYRLKVYISEVLSCINPWALTGPWIGPIWTTCRKLPYVYYK